MSFSCYPSLPVMLVMGMHWDFSFLDFGGFLAYGKCGCKNSKGKVESSLIVITKSLVEGTVSLGRESQDAEVKSFREKYH